MDIYIYIEREREYKLKKCSIISYLLNNILIKKTNMINEIKNNHFKFSCIIFLLIFLLIKYIF